MRRFLRLYNVLRLPVVSFLQTSRSSLSPSLLKGIFLPLVLAFTVLTMYTFGAAVFPLSRPVQLRTMQSTTVVAHQRYSRLLDALMVRIFLASAHSKYSTCTLGLP